jgi:hypothetical protein
MYYYVLLCIIRITLLIFVTFRKSTNSGLKLYLEFHPSPVPDISDHMGTVSLLLHIWNF